jgi:predicted DNA-binding transcriptional regulator YafY
MFGVPTGSSPTARALRTLEILRARPGTTADQLAALLGVTERAARRYVGILREAGIPVESARGPYGGYRLGRGTRLPPVVFTEEQALGLVMAVLDGQPAAIDADDLVGSALGKVIQALPESVGRQAAALRAYASAAPDRRSARPSPATTSALVAAVADRCRVLVTYGGESGEQWDAEVDPWAVVVRYGRWYLLCHSHRADAVRTYRVDRIREVRRTPHRFTPPGDLDPVAALEENLGAGWKYATRVVFHAPREEVAPWIRPPMGRLEPDGDRCVLVGTTRNPAMYAQEWLATVPFGFHVAEGPELRAAVAAVAARFGAALGEARSGESRDLRPDAPPPASPGRRPQARSGSQDSGGGSAKA